jgi:microcystin-dependent protein
MKKTALFTALLGLAQSTAHADVPLFINYQGKVADSTGLPIGASGTAAAPVAAPVNRKVIFRIYDASTGGNRLWSEEQTATISLGVFSVLLGNGINPTGTAATETRPALDTVFTPSAATSRFLEIMVDNGDNVINASDVAISPRQQITSTAFAFHAKVADGIASASDLTINPVTGTASNYGLGWYGASRPFGSTTTLDGPVLYGNTGGALGSNASGTRNMALNWDASGRVGIGAASIASTTNKLTLQGDMGTTPADQFTIRGTDTTKGLNIGFNTTLNQGTLQTYTGATYGNLVLNSAGGNVGIGTSTPTNRLTVESARQATASSVNAAAKIGGSDIYTYIGNYSSGSYAAWIQSMRTGDDLTFPLVLNPNGSNVGIGTTAPTAKLDVAGTARVQSTLTVDSGVTASTFTGSGASLTNLPGANLAPGTVTQAALIAAVKEALCPAGSIMAYGGTTAPTGWLLCDGTSYARTTYPNLFSAIGTAYGSPAGGLNFNVPDFRGRFLRGSTSDATRDPDYASRTVSAFGGNLGGGVGSYQADEFKTHTHGLPTDGFGSGDIQTTSNTSAADESMNDANPTGAKGGNETRPRNITVNYIIKQ